MTENIIVPKILQIETFYGCNARCTMCAVSLPPTRKRGMIDENLFKKIINDLSPYTNKIERVDLFALGEPLLDPYIFERIRYVKDKGFRNIGISTNADLLDKEKQKKLLESGIDTIIFSIDGVKKETHENIRRGVKFERVIQNCQDIIKMRDEGNYKTRFVIRMIEQKSNKNEWEIYKKIWSNVLSKKKNDLLIKYKVNTMGGEVFSKRDLLKKNDEDLKIEKMPCPMVFNRLIVLSDGSVPLCCEDTPRVKHCLGNVKTSTPIGIYNSKKMKNIRKIHMDGDKNKIDICNECTLLYSEKKQITL